MRCENKTFLQNDPSFLQEISSTAVEVGLRHGLCPDVLAFSIPHRFLTLGIDQFLRR
jgi:hypothetical protein